MPLYSESQAGYLHPLKYSYPWMETWKAFNLDTVLSIWLTGAGNVPLAPPARRAGRSAGRRASRARRIHLGAPGSYQHDQRASERSFRHLGAGMVVGTRAWRGVVLGALALACQVFAGHLQDVLLTSGHRRSMDFTAATGRPAAAGGAGMAVALVGAGNPALGGAVDPSKELLDRSPRAGGLRYQELTYASW